LYFRSAAFIIALQYGFSGWANPSGRALHDLTPKLKGEPP